MKRPSSVSGRGARLLMTAIACSVFICAAQGYALSGGNIDVEFESFFPGGGLREYVPIEMIFRCRNTGSEAISPYAEVTVSGGVYDADDNIVLKVDDKKYRIYNFWPGDRSGKLRLYIGSLKSGSYNLKLIVNTFNRVKNSNVSTSVFERPITVQ